MKMANVLIGLFALILAGCDFTEKELPSGRIVPPTAASSPQSTSAAQPPSGPPFAEKVVAGYDFSCALASYPALAAKEESGVLCWGANAQPARVPDLPVTIQAIAAGRGHVCASDGAHVWCWGRNHLGQLGNGKAAPSVTPTQVLDEKGKPLSGKISTLSSWGDHTCAVVDEKVWCWGSNRSAQLGAISKQTCKVRGPRGIQTLSCSTHALPAEKGAGATQLALGANHTCALVEKGNVQCWGANDKKQLGGTVDVPVMTDNGLEFQKGDGVALSAKLIAAGGDETCAWDGKSLKCWGAVLGQEKPTAEPQHVEVAGDVTKLALGSHHACVLLTGEALYCWGKSNSMETGFPDERKEPTDVLGNVWDVAVGEAHTCVTYNDYSYNGRGVKCWGQNRSGQLGLDPRQYQVVPDVSQLTWVSTWALPPGAPSQN